MGKSVGRVLLSGKSAGAIGVFHNADWLTETITQKFGYTNAVVKASPQAGLFFPSRPNHGLCVYEVFEVFGEKCPRNDYFEAAWMKYLVENSMQHHNCMADLNSAMKCWTAGILARYIKTPLFIAENRYDKELVHTEYLCRSCTSNKSEASNMVQKYMSYFGKNMEATLRELNQQFKHSVFMPNCFQHFGNLCMKGGISIDGHTYNKSLSNWFFNGAQYGLFDSCGDFPCS